MKFLIISYKSRNSIMTFAKSLRVNGINYTIINTPHSIYSGCSLSVKTEYRFLNFVINLIKQTNLSDFIGVFSNNNKSNYAQIERLI